MSESQPLSPIQDVANMFSVDDYMYFYSDHLTTDRSDAETAGAALLLGMHPARDGLLRVLDLACGFGRIANRLALLGHRVTGVEYLGEFLDLARAEAEQMGVLGQGRAGRVEYIQGDMRRIEYDAVFDRALMMFNSFGYFTDAENLDILRRVARALKPGGLLGFDVAHRDGVLNDFHPHYVSEKEGNLMINCFSFDVLTGRLRNDRIIIRDGVRKDRPFSIRLYAVTEMRAMLAQAGLELAGLYGDWDGQPLEMDSPAMVVTATKQN